MELPDKFRAITQGQFRFFVAVFLLLSTSALYSALVINRVTREIRDHRAYIVARDVRWEAKIHEIEDTVIQQDEVFHQLVGDINVIRRGLMQQNPALQEKTPPK